MAGWIKDVRRKVAFGSAAGVCLMIAGGFFSAAAWIVLAQVGSALIATTVLGCFYAGLAAVFAAVAMSRQQRSASDDVPLATEFPAVVQAFFEGMAQGRQARQAGS